MTPRTFNAAAPENGRKRLAGAPLPPSRSSPSRTTMGSEPDPCGCGIRPGRPLASRACGDDAARLPGRCGAGDEQRRPCAYGAFRRTRPHGAPGQRSTDTSCRPPCRTSDDPTLRGPPVAVSSPRTMVARRPDKLSRPSHRFTTAARDRRQQHPRHGERHTSVGRGPLRRPRPASFLEHRLPRKSWSPCCENFLYRI